MDFVNEILLYSVYSLQGQCGRTNARGICVPEYAVVWEIKLGRKKKKSANTQLTILLGGKTLPKAKLLDANLGDDVDIKVESPFRGVRVGYFIRGTDGGRIPTDVVCLTPPEWDQLMTGR